MAINHSYFKVLLYIVATCLMTASADDGPQIKINDGYLRGKYSTTKGGRTFVSFEGIPYARPPVKELRFKPPVPPYPWKGVRDATKVHAVCPQRDIYRRSPVIEGEEDCLYLNVYTPKLSTEESLPLPVMVFFHGGGWLCGGGNSKWYGPSILLDKNVILVVPNYRLGALGFLSTGDDILPGNNGLKDQHLALKWVKENIGYFGGDANQVTIFGESAGGASVHHHMVSPMSKGLFQRAISQSGTALCIWTISPEGENVRHAKMLAEALNCSSESTQEMVDCLRRIEDPYKFVETDKIFMQWDFDPMIPFKPVIEGNKEGAFIVEPLVDSVKSGKAAKVPWIVGINKDDGTLRAAGIYGNPHLIDELNDDFDKNAPISLMYGPTAKDIGSITKKIRKFYFGDRRIDNTTKQEVIDMYTDAWFMSCSDEAILLHRKYTKQPIYYYLFAHRGTSSFSEIFGDKINDYGVCHADELQYLFPLGDGLFSDKKPSKHDIEITEVMSTLWSNFAKTGDPTPTSHKLIENKWEPVKSEKMEYYLIGTKSRTMEEGLFIERAKFWRNLPTTPRKFVVKSEL